MKRIFNILLITLMFFVVEFVLVDMFGSCATPNILLVFVVFNTLSFGIGYGVPTAIFAGVLKDSFSIGLFGATIFSLSFSSYLSMVLRRNIYQSSSMLSKMSVVFIVCSANGIIQYLFQIVYARIGIIEAFRFVFVPEILTTLIAAPLIFYGLKKCASKLFG